MSTTGAIWNDSIGVFDLNVSNSTSEKWDRKENVVAVDILKKGGVKFFVVRDDKGTHISFGIDEEKFKLEHKIHPTRGAYLQVGRRAFVDGNVSKCKVILEGSNVQELYDRFEDFKNDTSDQYEPPSPSTDDGFDDPSSEEED